MGWDWRLRTAASTGLLFIPGWSWCGPCMMVLAEANSQFVYQRARAATSTVWQSCQCQQRHVWQPPVLSSGPAIWDISGESGRVGEGNENLVYPSPWDFKRSLTWCKILRHGTSSFASHQKEGVLRTFIALKNSTPWPDSNHDLWVQW
jgi:hypothetical protein